MSFTGKPETYLNTELNNGSFYPALSLGVFQKEYRVPVDLAEETVTRKLRLAANDINEQLEQALILWNEAGYASLSDAAEADGKDHETDYLTAVYCFAKSKLLKDYTTFSRRPIAEQTAKEGEDTEQSLRADSREAVRRLLGIKTNITVELL